MHVQTVLIYTYGTMYEKNFNFSCKFMFPREDCESEKIESHFPQPPPPRT